MRWRYGIKSEIGGKTGTTNDYTDGWFIGYTPQILAGAWVGCDDPFLKIQQSAGGSQMAMPEWAYFMEKVYKDKSLGIDPKATFQKPSELNNDPIFADQNFAAIANQGQAFDSADVEGNGNANDYAAPTDVPVESDFSNQENQQKAAPAERKPLGPFNYNPSKKDTSKSSANQSKKVKPKSKPNSDY
jgi:penicillin-binding protein 1A